MNTRLLEHEISTYRFLDAYILLIYPTERYCPLCHHIYHFTTSALGHLSKIPSTSPIILTLTSPQPATPTSHNSLSCFCHSIHPLFTNHIHWPIKQPTPHNAPHTLPTPILAAAPLATYTTAPINQSYTEAPHAADNPKPAAFQLTLHEVFDVLVHLLFNLHHVFVPDTIFTQKVELDLKLRQALHVFHLPQHVVTAV